MDLQAPTDFKDFKTLYCWSFTLCSTEKGLYSENKNKKKTRNKLFLELLFESVTAQAGASPARSPQDLSKLYRGGFHSISSSLCHIYPSVIL